MKMICEVLIILCFITTCYGENDVDCLASNIYHEARDQPIEGQLAIAFVTKNRVEDKREFRSYNTYCDVIRQGYRRGSRVCHFSWYCDGLSDTPYEGKKYKEILDFSKWFIDNSEYVVDPTKGSTHYHNIEVQPWWVNSLTKTIKIGDHVFYKK